MDFKTDRWMGFWEMHEEGYPVGWAERYRWKSTMTVQSKAANTQRSIHPNNPTAKLPVKREMAKDAKMVEKHDFVHFGKIPL